MREALYHAAGRCLDLAYEYLKRGNTIKAMEYNDRAAHIMEQLKQLG